MCPPAAHAADNSCINVVLERRTGIPITLSLVYMEVRPGCSSARKRRWGVWLAGGPVLGDRWQRGERGLAWAHALSRPSCRLAALLTLVAARGRHAAMPHPALPPACNAGGQTAGAAHDGGQHPGSAHMHLASHAAGPSQMD